LPGYQDKQTTFSIRNERERMLLNRNHGSLTIHFRGRENMAKTIKGVQFAATLVMVSAWMGDL
jgi:hypothetical protein